MYRYLDKRFYLTPEFEIDLRDFACGHLGVSSSPNIAELKRRIAPALAELESIGYLEPASADERYLKFKKGIWRIKFRRMGTQGAGRVASTPALPSTAPAFTQLVDRPDPTGPRALVVAFYQAWSPESRFEPTPTELGQAQQIVAKEGLDGALGLVGGVVALMRLKFPAAKRFGAALPYFDEAAKHARGRARQAAREAEAERRREAERALEKRRSQEDEAFLQTWTPLWNALLESDRERIRAEVLLAQPYLARPLMRDSRLALRFYLEALAKRSS